jgi:hypothetical protein
MDVRTWGTPKGLRAGLLHEAGVEGDDWFLGFLTSIFDQYFHVCSMKRVSKVKIRVILRIQNQFWC